MHRYLNKDLIFTNIDVTNDIEILKEMGKVLLEKGYVKKSFINAIIEREKDYPTGIETNGINIAIPHADPAHVLIPTLALAVSKKNIKFKRIDAPDKIIMVKAVFMLVIKNEETHLELLKKLMNFVGNNNVMTKICNCNTGDQILDIISNTQGDVIMR